MRTGVKNRAVIMAGTVHMAVLEIHTVTVIVAALIVVLGLVKMTVLRRERFIAVYDGTADNGSRHSPGDSPACAVVTAVNLAADDGTGDRAADNGRTRAAVAVNAAMETMPVEKAGPGIIAVAKVTPTKAAVADKATPFKALEMAAPVKAAVKPAVKTFFETEGFATTKPAAKAAPEPAPPVANFDKLGTMIRHNTMRCGNCHLGRSGNTHTCGGNGNG